MEVEEDDGVVEMELFGVVNACDVLSDVRVTSKATAEISWRTIIKDVRDVIDDTIEPIL